MEETFAHARRSLHDQVEKSNQHEHLLPFDDSVVQDCENVLAELERSAWPAPQVVIAEHDPITIDFLWIIDGDRGLCAFYNGGRIELKFTRAGEDAQPPIQVDHWRDAVDVIVAWPCGQPDD